MMIGKNTAKKFELYCPNHHLKRENDKSYVLKISPLFSALSDWQA